MTYTQVVVSTTPILIVAADNARRQFRMQNQGAVAVYYGPDDGITPSNTVNLPAGGFETFDDRWYRGAIYGVTASGSSTIAIWEVTE